METLVDMQLLLAFPRPWSSPQRGDTRLALAILARELGQRIDTAELDQLQTLLAARGFAGEVEP